MFSAALKTPLPAIAAPLAPSPSPPHEEPGQLAPVTPLREEERTSQEARTSEDGPGPGAQPSRSPRRSLDPWHSVGVIAFDSSTSEDRPPPEARTIQKLALYAFEVLEGARSAAQLGPWLLPDAATQLDERRARRVERRTLCKDRRRVLAVPGPVHIDRPTPNVVEATVVLHAEPRSTSVALRMEYLRQRWRITDLTVL